MQNHSIKLKAKDVLDFTEQLDSFISANITLDQSLEKLREIYEEGSPDKPITRMVKELQLEVITGKKFSEALSSFPDTFSRFYINMIEAGELSGNLAEILQHLKEYLKREKDLREEIKAAMIYPLIVIALAILITIFLLTSIVPRFEKMLQSSGQDLPIYTSFLMEISNFLTSYKGLLLIIFWVLVFYSFRHYIKTPAGKRWFDAWLLKIPLFGTLVQKSAVARFSLSLGILLHSKVDMLTALAIGEGVVGNKILEDAVSEATLRVNVGENMSPSLRNFFPLKAVQMLEVGENNAQLPEMAISVATRYEKEVKSQLKIITSLLEPALLVILGAIVCFVALAIYLPMLNAIQYQ